MSERNGRPTVKFAESDLGNDFKMLNAAQSLAAVQPMVEAQQMMAQMQQQNQQMQMQLRMQRDQMMSEFASMGMQYMSATAISEMDQLCRIVRERGVDCARSVTDFTIYQG